MCDGDSVPPYEASWFVMLAFPHGAWQVVAQVRIPAGALMQTPNFRAYDLPRESGSPPATATRSAPSPEWDGTGWDQVGWCNRTGLPGLTQEEEGQGGRGRVLWN